MSVLPVEQVYSQVVEQLKNNDQVILQAPPGAGKSTWLPLQLVKDNHFQRVIMLEPRRVAARNIANYLASCLNEKVGETIGLRMRAEKKVSAQTRLEIVTEGMLVRMLQSDPELSGVDLLIFDEFHERSLNVDTALAFSLEAQAVFNESLKLLIMSATLAHDKLTAKLGCPVIVSEGRSYDVSEHYFPLKSSENWLTQLPQVIVKAYQEQSGDILVFLPGQKEINAVQQSLEQIGLFENTCLLQLSGNQDKKAQQMAIAPAANGLRKIVLTTNVAETSLTIEGIKVVVDSGKRRASSFNLKTGVTQLRTTNISKSSAVQRAGRAGRIEAGAVYRLGTKEEFERKVSHDQPEILSQDISQLLLEASIWGSELEELMLLDMPSTAQKSRAIALLQMLEAFDENEKVTEFANKLLNYGSELRFAHLLIKAKQLEKQYPGLYLLAVYFVALQEANIRVPVDLAIALNQQLHRGHPSFNQQLQFWLSKLKLKKTQSLPLEHLDLIVALAFPDRIAKRRGQGIQLANGAGIKIPHDFTIHSDYLCIAQLGGEGGQVIFSACECDIDKIKSVLPHLCTDQDVCEYQEKNGRFSAVTSHRLGALVLKESPIQGGVDKALRMQAWLTLIRKNGFALFNQDPVDQLMIRLQLAGDLFPESFIKSSQAILLVDLESWLGPYLDEVKTLEQLKKLDLHEALMSQYSWQEQQQLAALLPCRITVPTGSHIKVTYQINGIAKLSVKMQEVYGMTESPKVANGKLTLAMELLSPAMRPLQITQNLASFWRDSYKEVQKEMKGRYPKHFWPDDPANSQATNRVKSRM